MEGNISSRNIMQSNTSYVGFDLQVPVRIHHHHHQPPPPPPFTSHHRQQGSLPSSVCPPTIHENFPLTNQETHTPPLTDFNKLDRIKSTSDDDEPSFNEAKRSSSSSSQWHRVKWTDAMVRLLITAVSYITEETSYESTTGPKRKFSCLQKKGKWKSISKVMADRGHLVSPQQCEDKFNDLNKRYKRLNEILGRGTSCEVVENPTLLDVMDHIPEKSKDEVRKILSSKHLHYEEMCSYHNGNRLHLPPDPELQHSLRSALRNRDDHEENHESEFKRHSNEENGGETDEHEEGEFEDRDGVNSFAFKTSFDCETGFDKICGEGAKTSEILRKGRRDFRLEEQRLYIEAQMLELEREKFKWQRFCRKKDRELEMTRMEIERMRLENERMALELRRKEMGIDEN